MQWIKKYKDVIEKYRDTIRKYMGILRICVAIGVIFYAINLEKETLTELGQGYGLKVKVVDGKFVDEEYIEDDYGYNSKEYIKLMTLMHKMSNTKIVPKDGYIVGKRSINKHNIEKARKIINENNFTDKKYLLNVLKQWEKGNFKNAVSQHNYFWSGLDGTLGEAIKLK
jgi:hypothetical protein